MQVSDHFWVVCCDSSLLPSLAPRSTKSLLLDKARPARPTKKCTIDSKRMTTEMQLLRKVSASSHFATQPSEQVLAEQNVNLERGLSSQEVAFRLKLAGPNELTVDEKETLLSKFVDQFKNPLILLLFGSATVSVLMGQYDDAVSITLVSHETQQGLILRQSPSSSPLLSCRNIDRKNLWKN
jgi:magnesium-transporting ATPase (P-type)